MIARTGLSIVLTLSVLLFVPHAGQGAVTPRAQSRNYLDGVGTCGHVGNPNCDSQRLTTTQDEDVVIVVAWCLCHSKVPTVADDNGLEFSLRALFVPGQNTDHEWPLWEFYAVTDNALTNDTISLLIDKGQVTKDFHLQAFAVRNANADNMLEGNDLLPSVNHCPGVDSVNGGYFSCTATSGPLPNDFFFVITAINDAPPCPDPSIYGFKELARIGGDLDVDYTFARHSAGVSFTCMGGPAPGTDPVAMILDAVPLD